MIVLGLLAALVGVPAGASPSVPMTVGAVSLPAQVESLSVDAVTTYRLDPPAGVIEVTVEATVTNTAPPRRRGDFIETPYFDSFGTAAIGPVVDANATALGRPLTTTIEPGESDDVDFVVVDLAPDLVYGSPQTIVIVYDIPAQASRSDYATRINEAFASWYVVGTGTGGAADIVVDVPERFEVDFTEEVVHSSTVADGRAVYRFDDLAETDAFFGVSARDDDALVKRRTVVDDDAFEIQAWPGDEAWADFAVDAVERGVPVLASRTGLELAGARAIAIAETATPYLYGYAGWYLPEEDRIEIGDEFDLQVMLHELSHLWFNGTLFESRWINEGLAEVVSNDIARSFGEEHLEAAPIDPGAPGARPLNEWVNPGADPDAEAIETFGYGASYTVMQALVDEIGDDGLQTLVTHADADLLPYLGDPEPEDSPGVSDWRYLYDIAERVVGSEEIADLFDEHVLRDADRAAVTARAVALDRYGALDEAGDGWSPPVEVRRGMSSWDFDAAARAMDDADIVLAGRSTLDTTLAPVGIPVPAALEDSYESASDLDDTTRLLASLGAVALEIVEADRAVDDVGLLGRIGLLGASATADRDAALAAFDAGAAEEAGQRAAAVLAATDGAVAAGAVRVAAAVVILVGLALLLRRIRRRSSVAPEGDRLVEHPGDLGADLGPIDEPLGERDPHHDRP